MGESRKDSVDRTLATVRNLMKEIGMGRNDGEAELDLGATLTIREITTTRDAWLASLPDDVKRLSLGAGNLHEVDTAGMQLLLALVRRLATRGIEIRWQDRSNAFDEIVDRLGMRESLGI